ncbi:MAG: LTA synthase family protein, partial [Patescibacteria group bacterium]
MVKITRLNLQHSLAMKQIFKQLTPVIKRLRAQTVYYLFRARMPLALIALLVLQTHFFNIWLGLDPNQYLVRRTASAAALGFLLFGPAVLLKKKTGAWYLGVISSATAIIFICQFLYYSYSGGFLQPTAFFYLRQGLTVLDTVKTLLSFRLLVFLFGPIIVIIAGWWERREKISEPEELSKKDKIAISIVIFLAVTLGNGYLFLRETMEGGFTYIYEYKRLFDVNLFVSKVGILNFSIGNIVASGLRADKATAAEIDFAKQWVKKHVKPPTAGEKFGVARGRNLIIIQIESFENAVINEKVNGQEITPILNKLVADGLYFSNYYAPIGPGTTADAEFMSLNSLFALPDRVAFIDYAHHDYAALPSLLAKNGYQTFALHGDVPSFWNRANMYPKLGYQKWYGRKDYTIPRKIGAYDLGDKDFFLQSIPIIKTFPQPFLATLITLTSHVPYQLPPDLQKLTIPSDSPLHPYHRDYLQSAHYADESIGAFVAELKANNLYENSLIAIFGDHGSFTNIGAGLGKNKTAFAELQNSQIPLILIAPDADLHGVVDKPASHLDFYPTVAHLLGINPPPSILGQDLLTTKTPLVIHRNLISGTIKNIISDKLAYEAAPDGIFSHGICLALPEKKKLSPDECQTLYDNKEDLVRVSDTIIKGGLVPT